MTPQPLSIDCRLLSSEELDATAELLAAAFLDDSAYAYLMPDEATRQAGLSDFFRRNLRLHLPYRCTHVAFEAGRLIGTVTLRPPAGVPISTLTMLRYGLLPFWLAHGRKAVDRLRWLKRTYDALEAEASARAPHRYVHMMAVEVDCRGRGVGSKLLGRVLETSFATQDSSAPTVLTTHKPSNVAFYRRAGFEVVDERLLAPPRAAPYTVWSMSRGRGVPPA